MKKNKNKHFIKTKRCSNDKILNENNHIFFISDFIDDKLLNSSKIYDIVLHLRLDDFNDTDDYISFEYLEKLFYKIDFTNKKIGIVLQKPDNINDSVYLQKVIQWFSKNNIKINIESNDVITDFHIMKNAKILISSMSTLCWCSAYFSKRIELFYMPNYNFYNKSSRFTYFKKPIDNTIFYDVATTKNKLKIKVYITTSQDPTINQLNNIKILRSYMEQLNLDYELFITNDIRLVLLYNNKDIKLDLYKKILNDNANDDYNHYLIIKDNSKLNLLLYELYQNLENIEMNDDQTKLTFFTDSYIISKTEILELQIYLNTLNITF